MIAIELTHELRDLFSKVSDNDITREFISLYEFDANFVYVPENRIRENKLQEWLLNGTAKRIS